MKKFAFLPIVTAFLLLSFAQSSFAATEKGFRLNLGAVPGVNEAEVEDSGTSFTVDLDDKSGINFNPAFVFRTNTDRAVGFVGAFGLFVRGHTGEDDSGDEVELTAYGVSIAPGLAVKLSQRVHMEIKAELGLGGAEQSVTGFSDGSGPYASLGVNVGAYAKLNKVLVLGGDIGYMAFASDGELDFGGYTVDTTYSGDGLTLNASIGFMF